MVDAGHVIEAADPDVVLLQEISPERLAQLTTQLHLSNSPLTHITHDPERLLAVLSCFPILKMSTLGTDKALIQKVRLALSRNDIFVFNVHFIRDSARQRNESVNDFIRSQLLSNHDPVIVGGDFNCTAHTTIYKSFYTILNNAYDEAGWGFGFTFPAINMLHLPAMVRIDHIFYSSHFKVTTAKVLSTSGGSDHYPILAKLVISPI